MQARIAMTTLGVLLLLSACSGPSGTDPETSTSATNEPAATTGSGTEAAPDGMAAPPAAADSGGAKAAADATAAAPAEDDSAVTAQIETLLGGADQYKAVFTALQTAVAANDKAAVAGLVEFPLTVSVGGQRVISNADQFVKEYDRIITPPIAATITGQAFADVLVNTQGVMFGDGEVWLSGSCEDDACSKQVVTVARIQEVKGTAEFPLTVEVALSDAAARQMKQKVETTVVEASYFGFATPEAKDEADDLGMVDLGSATAELAVGANKAEFDGSRFKRDRLKSISGGPRVNINVYSGRHASEDNILDCDSYEDNLATATRSPITLSCELLQGE